MRQVTINTPVNVRRLCEELEAAIPAMAPDVIDGERYGNYTLGVGSNFIVLTAPDEVSESAIQAVIAAHDPTPDPVPEPETPPTEILLSLLQDVTDADETKPILEAMLLILGGND